MRNLKQALLAAGTAIASAAFLYYLFREEEPAANQERDQKQEDAKNDSDQLVEMSRLIKHAMDLSRSPKYEYPEKQEALRCFTQALQIAARLFGEQSIEFSTVLNDCAIVAGEMGNAETMVDLLEKVLPIYERLIGQEAEQYVKASFDLAVGKQALSIEKGDANLLQDALRLMNWCQPRYVQYFGVEDKRTLELLSRIRGITGDH